MNKYTFNPLLKHPGYNIGGGGGGGHTTTTQYTSSLPEYAEPYFMDVMGRAQEASLTPYQTYGGERVAGFSPYQEAAQQMTGQIALGGTPTALQAGQQLAGLTAGQLAGFNYDPAAFGYQQIYSPDMNLAGDVSAKRVSNPNAFGYQQIYSPDMNLAGDVSAERVSNPNAFGYQQIYSPDMNLAGDVSAERVSNPNAIYYDLISSGQLGPQMSSADYGLVQNFMNPYMQGVVDVEKQAAARDYQIAQQMRQAQAATTGAYGGSRQAVAEAEANRALMSQLQGIQSTGLNRAYDQAQAALQAERASQMQAGQFNIQSALQAAQANQQTGLQANIRYTELSQQAQIANQQAALAAAQGNQQQANQMYARAAELNQQAQITNQQAYAEAQRQAEASRQFGATSSLQALGQLGAEAQRLGAMGEAEQKMALERAQALSGVGKEQQALQQQQLDQAYSEFASQRDYEQNMINWYNAILRGTPISMNQAVYQTAPAPSTASQFLGAGLGGLGLYQGLK